MYIASETDVRENKYINIRGTYFNVILLLYQFSRESRYDGSLLSFHIAYR